MHPTRPSLLGFPDKHGRVPRQLLSPPMLLFGLSPMADSQTRCPLEVSQPCGLENDLLCCRPLRAWQSLVQQTSSGPAVTLMHRDVSRSSRAHCVRWVARLYQMPSLSYHRWVMTGLDNWTSRRHHLSRTLWTGQYIWAPEAFTCPVTLDRPGRLDFVKTTRSLYWKGRLAFF